MAADGKIPLHRWSDGDVGSKQVGSVKKHRMIMVHDETFDTGRSSKRSSDNLKFLLDDQIRTQ